jgi:hypothetical protein
MERAWVRPDIVSQAGIIPITVAGIDAADEYASYTGVVTSPEYALTPTAALRSSQAAQ